MKDDDSPARSGPQRRGRERVAPTLDLERCARLVLAVDLLGDEAQTLTLAELLERASEADPELDREVKHMWRLLLDLGSAVPGSAFEVVVAESALERLLGEPEWEHPSEVLGEEHVPIRELLLLAQGRLLRGEGDPRAVQSMVRQLWQCAVAEGVDLDEVVFDISRLARAELERMAERIRWLQGVYGAYEDSLRQVAKALGISV